MSDTVIVSLIGAAALILSTWMQRGRRSDVKAARVAAETTVVQTKATSNGFAQHVRDELKSINDRLTIIEEQI